MWVGEPVCGSSEGLYEVVGSFEGVRWLGVVPGEDFSVIGNYGE